MSYLHSIHKSFLETIEDKQDFLFKPFVKSKEVESDEMFQSIYRNLLAQKNRRAFLVSDEVKKQYRCDTIEKFLKENKRYTYFTPAVSWHHKLRTKEELIWLTCIILDFDFSKDGTGRSYTNDELSALLINEFDLTPNYIWDTKTPGNKQVCFLIEPMTGTMNSIFLWESIVKRLSILVGSDFHSTDAVHLFRIPKRGLYKYSDEVYDIDDFRFVFDNEEIESLLERERRDYKLVSFSEKQVMNHKSIKMLLDAEFDGSRNHAAFTIALLYYALGKDEQSVFDLLNGAWFDEVNEKSSKPFFRNEVTSAVKSAYSGKYSGPSKEWITFLTGEEFPFNLWKSSYVKKSDSERIYKDGEKVRRKIISWVREFTGETIHQKELSSKLDIPLRTLKRQISNLKSEGVIDYQTQRGRYSKGTTFEYIPNENFEIQHDNVLKNVLPEYEGLDEKQA